MFRCLKGFIVPMNKDAEHDRLTDAIGRSPWFEGLPGSALETLASAARVRQYEKHAYLFRTGESTNDLFCILRGRVRLLLTSALGQEFALTDLEPEAWLNEAALAGDMTCIFDAEVVVAAEVLVLPRAAVIEIGRKHPALYRPLFENYVAHSRGIMLLLQGMAFYPLKARLAGWLLQLVDNHGEQTGRGIELDLQINQQDLAQLSLGSRQRINKILSE